VFTDAWKASLGDRIPVVAEWNTELHVDNRYPGAEDNNSGSATAPLLTIGAAVKRGQTLRAAGNNVRIRIRAGIYREYVFVYGFHPGDPVLSIEADPGVILSGSDVFTSWQRGVGTDVFVHDWLLNWGPLPVPPGWEILDLSELARRRELLFVDGVPLRQVLTYGELTPGTFCVDEAANRLYVLPVAPDEFLSSTVEVSVRPRGLFVQTSRNVIVDGLTIQHVAAPFQGGAFMVNDGDSVRILNTVARWNNHKGFTTWNMDGLTIRNLKANDNAHGGFGFGKTRKLHVENIEGSRNNWRGVETGFVGWDLAGTKSMWIHDVYIKGLVTNDNFTRGFWVDNDIARVLVENPVIRNNRHNGMFLEVVQGPLVFVNADIDANDQGISFGNVTNFALLDSVVNDSVEWEVWVGGLAERHYTDHETGERIGLPYGENWTLLGNKISTKSGVLFGTWSQEALDLVAATLVSDDNVWESSSPTPFHSEGHEHGFDWWRQVTGQEANSTFVLTG
jgi:hypothetical protein